MYQGGTLIVLKLEVEDLPSARVGLESGFSELLNFPETQLFLLTMRSSKCPAHHDGSVMGMNWQILCSSIRNTIYLLFPKIKLNLVLAHILITAENSLRISFSFAPGL